MQMQVQVQCCSTDEADVRPVRFGIGSKLFVINEILDRWYGPADEYFKVRADDGNLYVLRRHAEPTSGWTLEAFRASREDR
jgi:hypothetical protein